MIRPHNKVLRQRLVIFVLVVANLSLASYVLARRYGRKSDLRPVAESQKLPILDLETDSGHYLNTASFLGSALFVQLIDPDVGAQISALVAAREHRRNGPVKWLLLTENSRALRSRLPAGSDDIVIVKKDSEALRYLFSLSKCCTQWEIFDHEGGFRRSGRYDNGEAGSELASVVDGTRPYSTELLREAFNNLNDQGKLGELYTRPGDSSKTVVVAMFSRVCSACPDGALIDFLNDRAKNDHSTQYLVLMPGTATKSDIKNLTTNLQLEIPVRLAGQDFTRQWNALNEQYGEKAINGTVLLISQRKIVSAVNGIPETKHLLKGITPAS